MQQVLEREAVAEDGEALSWLNGAVEPMVEAVLARRRWRYIHQVAVEAQSDRIIDRTLPQVLRDPGAYVDRSLTMISALDAWITLHT